MFSALELAAGYLAAAPRSTVSRATRPPSMSW
jgi:hypothetical protein